MVGHADENTGKPTSARHIHKKSRHLLPQPDATSSPPLYTASCVFKSDPCTQPSHSDDVADATTKARNLTVGLDGSRRSDCLLEASCGTDKSVQHSAFHQQPVSTATQPTVGLEQPNSARDRTRARAVSPPPARANPCHTDKRETVDGTVHDTTQPCGGLLKPPTEVSDPSRDPDSSSCRVQ